MGDATRGSPILYEGQHRLALWHRSGLSAIRATAAGDGLYDLDLFAGTGVLDKVTDVDDALVAGVGALEAGVMRLCGVVMILSRWGCAGALDSPVSTVSSPYLWAGAGECANTRPAQ